MGLEGREIEQPSPQRYWQISPDTELFLAHWDNEEEAVVYQPGSGDTYLINDIARRVIIILQESSASAVDIYDRIGASFGALPRQEIIAQLENLLSGLLKVGLVRFHYR